MTNSKIKLRDFIYLDVERVKSLLAQLEGGYPESETQQKDSSHSVRTTIEGQLPMLARLEAGHEYAFSNTSTKSSIYHDFAYNRLEFLLKDQERLKAWKRKHRDQVVVGDFVIYQGPIWLDDYEYLIMLLSEQRNLMEAIGILGNVDSFVRRGMFGRAELLKDIRESFEASESPRETIAAWETVIDLLLGQNIIVRTDYDIRDKKRILRGTLVPSNLRQSPEHLRFHYGQAPAGDWFVCGQVSTVVSENKARSASAELAPHNRKLQPSENLDHMASLLEPLRGAFFSDRDILINPIAIYRE